MLSRRSRVSMLPVRRLHAYAADHRCAAVPGRRHATHPSSINHSRCNHLRAADESSDGGALAAVPAAVGGSLTNDLTDVRRLAYSS